MGDTAIEWTDKTWNPVVGCTKVSTGCKSCYAKTLHDQRHKAHQTGKQMPLQYAQPFEVVQLMPDRLSDPLAWRKPQRVFVNSVSDLFHEDVPDEFIDRVFAVMACCQRHTFQVLTKRPQRMAEYMENALKESGRWDHHLYDGQFWWPDASEKVLDEGYKALTENIGLPNVWLGTSVENQAAADERIPHLLRVPAAVRFLSCEPLLGPVEFSNVTRRADCLSQLGKKALDGIHWVIVGGESGPNARPMDPDWARSLRDQCQAVGVAYFFKQWGEYIHANPNELHLSPGPIIEFNGIKLQRVGKKIAGRTLDGREWSEFPVLASKAVAS